MQPFCKSVRSSKLPNLLNETELKEIEQTVDSSMSDNEEDWEDMEDEVEIEDEEVEIEDEDDNEELDARQDENTASVLRMSARDRQSACNMLMKVRLDYSTMFRGY
jgi:hypothetical protein